MSSDHYYDYIVSDTGLYCVPSITPLITESLWEQLNVFINSQTPNPSLEKLFEKNPTYRNQISCANIRLKKLPQTKIKTYYLDQGVHKHRSENFYYVYTGNFTSKLKNQHEKGSWSEKNQTFKQRDWMLEEFFDLIKYCPDFNTIVRKISKLAKIDPAGRFFAHGITEATKIAIGLENKTYQAKSAEVLDQHHLQKEGVAVCVFVNKEGMYLSSGGHTQSITGARMYESLVAAQRSINASNLHAQDLTFVEVEVSFKNIMHATNLPAKELLDVQALKTKEDIQSALQKTSPPDGNVEQVLASKKKTKKM